MDREWNDSQPIYRQLRDRVVAMILDGVLKEGDPLPSVRIFSMLQRLGLDADALLNAAHPQSSPAAPQGPKSTPQSGSHHPEEEPHQ